MRKKGISLVELLAVVVIMGIIAGIAIPLVGKIIDDVERKSVLADAQAIASAAQTYCIKNSSEAMCNETLTNLVLKEVKLDKKAENFDEYISKQLSGKRRFREYKIARILKVDNSFHVQLVEGTKKRRLLHRFYNSSK